MLMANLIDFPQLWMPAISVLSVIVVAADIILFIFIFWFERQPRTWIIIYTSNYHFSYKLIPVIFVKF